MSKKELESKKAEPVKTEPVKTDKDLAYERDHKMVKGIFRFHELPKGEMSFPFKKHFGDQVEKYHMKDGEVYTVPYMVARHLNTNCAYPTYEYKNDETGRPVTTYAEQVRRCSFQSLEFSGIEENTNEAIPAAI